MTQSNGPGTKSGRGSETGRTPSPTHQLPRRDFLKTAGAGVGLASAAVAAPTIVPARVFGGQAPSNTLRIGAIGNGRMGRGDMGGIIAQGNRAASAARIVAVCDVDRLRAERARRMVRAKYLELDADRPTEITQFEDYRELLQQTDIDGVSISTPDHMHAPIAIAAARAGKDIYVQKPMTYTVAEGRQLVKAVNDNDVILQIGSQQRSDQRFRRACELVHNGRIGQLKRIHVQLPIDSGNGDPTPMTIPENLNYDSWLGPTAELPYTQDRVHPQSGFSRPGWLQIECYCRGMITGWGAHMFDIAQWGHGSDDSGPVEMQATGEFPDRGLFDVHTRFEAAGVYADGVELTAATDPAAGVRFTGSDGWLFVRRGGWEAHDPDILQMTPADDESVQLYRSQNHYGNFLECMKTRKQPACPVEIGHRSNTICVIVHIAMKLGRKLKWDPQTEQFIDDQEANSMLHYEYRQPWKL